MLFWRKWKGGEEEGLRHTVVAGGGIVGATAGLLRLGRPRILQEQSVSSKYKEAQGPATKVRTPALPALALWPSGNLIGLPVGTIR